MGRSVPPFRDTQARRLAMNALRVFRTLAPATSLALLLILVWCALRFAWLEGSPKGFFMDESRGALHVMCLAESGVSGDGKRWPLFASGFAGGFYTPPYLYGALAWTWAVGTSPAAFRAFSAFANVLTLVGLFVLVRSTVGPRAALFALLAGALSPWSWQFSRIAWDPPLAPAFLVWGTYAFAKSPRPWTQVSAGGLFSLAMYAYPPLRATTPLWVLTLVVLAWRHKTHSLRHILTCLAAMTLVTLPLAMVMFAEGFTNRSASLSILSRDFIEGNRGGMPAVAFVAETFLGNVFAHLHPRYLLFRGDANLRHSSQLIGQLGPIDVLAILLALAFVVRSLVFERSSTRVAPRAVGTIRWALLALWGAFLGTLPAALTWEGLPHALRSIATWPFVAMFSGVVLAAAAEHLRKLAPFVVLVGAAHTVLFLPKYLRAYDSVDNEWFHPEVSRRFRDRARSADEAVKPLLANYSDMQLRYHLMRRGLSCAESQRRLEALRRSR